MQNTKRDLISIYSGIIEKYKMAEKSISQNLAGIDGFSGKVDFSSSLRVISQQISTSKNKFTIATVGEFKAGKSTTLNTILGLQGDACLSCEFRPDTAKAIRIMKKSADQDYEAEIIYDEESGFEPERMSWIEAKQYTSQVKIDSDKGLANKASLVDEVRYYIDNPLLDSCNFLDLPGTGFIGKHDTILKKKINECDAVMWIVSNLAQPGKNALDSLGLLKKNLIPVVNVMYSIEEKKEMEDLLSFEEMKDFLERNFQSYLGDFEIIKYCAKAIEIWMQDESAFNEDVFGRAQINETIYDLIHGEKDLEEEKKSRTIDNVREACGVMNQQVAHIVELLKEYQGNLDLGRNNNSLIRKKIERAYAANLLELKSLSGNSANEIIDKMKTASDLFIEDKMATTSITLAMRTFTKKGREKLEAELEEEYKKKYLEIDDYEDSDSWINAISDDFRDNLAALCVNEYLNADIEQNDLAEVGQETVEIGPKYFDAIGKNMAIVFKQQMKEYMPLIISSVLAYIPGHEVVDLILLLSSIVGKLGRTINKSEDKLVKRVEQTKRRARHSISLQRIKIQDQYKQIGKQYNMRYRDELFDRLEIMEDTIEVIAKKIKAIFVIEDELNEYFKECSL